MKKYIVLYQTNEYRLLAEYMSCFSKEYINDAIECLKYTVSLNSTAPGYSKEDILKSVNRCIESCNNKEVNELTQYYIEELVKFKNKLEE